MKTIDQMIDDVLKHEGGYVNHKDDKGGPTNLGVTQATLSDYLNRQASIDDVKKLTKQTACDIYKKCYYTDPCIDKLPNLIQPLMFDMSINHGYKKAAKLLQELLSKKGYDIGGIDGAIGNKTCACSAQAVKSLGNEFVNQLVEMRISFYNAIVHNNPSQKVFLKGWLTRANSFRI
jgi:lysozyme family protein